jgi:hypothetical protein
MRLFALIDRSKVTVLPHGSGRFCSKKLSANSTMQQMVFARIVRVRVLRVHSPVAVATVEDQSAALLWRVERYGRLGAHVTALQFT